MIVLIVMFRLFVFFRLFAFLFCLSVYNLVNIYSHRVTYVTRTVKCSPLKFEIMYVVVHVHELHDTAAPLGRPCPSRPPPNLRAPQTGPPKT
jgi:hypothetical protein